MTKPKTNATIFRKSKPKTDGRGRGTPNKKTQFLKEALLMAIEAAGNKKRKNGIVSYLTWADECQPRVSGLVHALSRLICDGKR